MPCFITEEVHSSVSDDPGQGYTLCAQLSLMSTMKLNYWEFLDAFFLSVH